MHQKDLQNAVAPYRNTFDSCKDNIQPSDMYDTTECESNCDNVSYILLLYLCLPAPPRKLNVLNF